MIRLFLTLCLLFSLAVPVSAAEIEAPEVPRAGEEWMPQDTSSFSDALLSLLQKALYRLRPELKTASRVSVSLFCGVLLLGVLKPLSGGGRIMETAASVLIASVLLENTDSLIHLGAETVQELSEYGRLLLPVMTTALAAQGGAASSAVLYAGTALFDTVLSRLISKLLVPMVYVFLALGVANAALGQEVLKKLRDFLKWAITWCLKTILTVFTAYMGISGVVSGTTDAVALKATKMTISSVVPVVGGILSDASEAVLVSAGLMKNAAGIYGILAALALFLSPFIKIGAQYLVLKVTAALCALFGPKSATDLIEDFSAAMGFLLAMTGSSCFLLLISTICFLKGVG